MGFDRLKISSGDDVELEGKVDDDLYIRGQQETRAWLAGGAGGGVECSRQESPLMSNVE
jgi:hypothetical protein